MALVRSGCVFTVYIDDAPKGMLTVASISVVAADMLSIGNFNATPAGFAGVVEARVFTFTDGGRGSPNRNLTRLTGSNTPITQHPRGT